MPKPRISLLSPGHWLLTYQFPARQFWLFGATTAERAEIKSRCITTEIHPTLVAALDALKSLYKQHQIAK